MVVVSVKGDKDKETTSLTPKSPNGFNYELILNKICLRYASLNSIIDLID